MKMDDLGVPFFLETPICNSCKKCFLWEMLTYFYSCTWPSLTQRKGEIPTHHATKMAVLIMVPSLIKALQPMKSSDLC